MNFQLFLEFRELDVGGEATSDGDEDDGDDSV